MSRKRKENGLLDRLKNDPGLDKDKNMRREYLALAKIYTDDFEQNLNKTSMELDNMYYDLDIGVDTWKAFLEYPLVDTYLEAFRNEKMLAEADSRIMSGDNPQHALKVREEISKRGKVTDRSNFVLMFLPDIRGYGDYEIQEITNNTGDE